MGSYGKYEVQWKRSAEKELRRLDPQQIPRIIQAVSTLVDDPFPRGFRKLRGAERAYRIRIGDYRVIYQVDVKVNVVTIYHVRHRRKAYRQ